MTNRRADRRWSEEGIIFLIKDWVSKYGDPPTIKEWDHSPDHPSGRSVQQYFGSWSSAMLAAGVKPRKRGAPSHLLDDTGL